MKLRHIIGKRELKRSLRTKEQALARQRFGPVHAEFTRRIENARRHANGERPLNTRDIEILADRWLQKTLDDAEQTGTERHWYYWQTETDTATGKHHQYADSPLWDSLAATAKQEGLSALAPHIEEITGDEIRDLLTEHDLSVSPASSEYQHLAQRIAAKVRPLVDHLSRREQGRYSAPKETMALEPLSREAKHKGMTITEAWEAYLQRLERNHGKSLATRRGKEYRASVIGLAEYHGNLPLNQLTADHLREYRDFLYGLPQRPPKAVSRLPIRQRPKAALSRGLGTLSRVTVRNRMIHCSALFREAIDMPKSGITANPMETVKLPPRQTMRDQGKRPDFQTEELSSIFDGDWFRPFAHRSRDRFGIAAVWLPVALYYTGARLEEIAAMTAADVRIIEGTWSFDIRPHGEARTVKNVASIRPVPVHSDLIELGLLDYVDGLPKDGKLWPTLTPNSEGKYGHSLSRRFREYLTCIGIRKDVSPQHGFRHTFTTLLRESGLDEAIVSLLTGHVNNSQTSQYGSHSNELRAKGIDRLPSIPGLENIRASLRYLE